MTILQYILLSVTPLLGGLTLLFVKPGSVKNIFILLSFSGAFLFSITILHLIPDIFATNGEDIGIYILGGFLLQIILEQFSKGIEHGHIHPPENTTNLFIWSLMIGLSFHAFLEGIPLASSMHLADSHNQLFYGIVLHKVPAAFALMSIMLIAGVPRATAVLLLIIFVSMSPLAVLLSDTVVPSIATIGGHDFFKVVLAVVVGSFLHISTTILFEASTKIHTFTFLKILAILSGIGLALFMH